EPVGVALPADLAVGDDVQARVLLRPDGQQRRVLMRLFQVLRVHPPQLTGPDPGREPGAEPLPVDQPVRLRVAAPERGGEEHAGPPPGFTPGPSGPAVASIAQPREGRIPGSLRDCTPGRRFVFVTARLSPGA